jgi:hypothetical protein
MAIGTCTSFSSVIGEHLREGIISSTICRHLYMTEPFMAKPHVSTCNEGQSHYKMTHLFWLLSTKEGKLVVPFH